MLRIEGGVWLMMSVERNADLDDVTEEDIEELALNDDQLRAIPLIQRRRLRPKRDSPHPNSSATPDGAGTVT